MANIALPILRQTEQPQRLAKIDWRNPLTKDLAAAFVFSNGLRDAVSGKFAVNKGVVFDTSPLGQCIRPVTAGIAVPWSMGFTTEDLTITLIETRRIVPEGYWMIADNREAGAGYIYGAGASFFNPAGTLTAPGRKVISVCRNEFYQDGVKTNAAIGTGLIPAPGMRLLGRYTDADAYVDGKIAAIYIHRRNISAVEHQALCASPWQIFRPESRYLFAPAPASGSNLSASGQSIASGSAAPALHVALSAVGVALASGSAAAKVSIPLSAAGVSIATGSANRTATVTISGAGLAQAAGQAGLSASVLRQAAGAAQAAGNAALAAQLNALAAGVVQATGSANLSGGAPGALSASGQAQAAGSALLSISIGLSAAGAAQAAGGANLSGGAPGALAATGAAMADGWAAVSALVTLTAAGFVQAMGTGSFSAQIPLAATGQASASGSASASLDGLVRNFRLACSPAAAVTRIAASASLLTRIQHEVMHG